MLGVFLLGGATMDLREKISQVFPGEEEIPRAHQLPGLIEQREYLCDGEIRIWDGPMQEVISPVCRRTSEGLKPRKIGSFPLLTERESMAALSAAKKAYDQGRGYWPTLPVEKRIRHIEEFVLKMKAKRAEVVKLLMWEIGKPLKDSEKEFDRTVDYVLDTANALKELDRVGSRFVIEQKIIGQIRRAPLGVVLCMGPYNYPLNETFTTLIPALIMGNTVIFKPPKLGVLLHRPLLEAFRDSFPPGVVNTIYGEGTVVVPPLMSSGNIDVLAFIGSSRVADLLKHQHPKPHRLRCVLGLDAKNAAILLPDAELEITVQECLAGSLSFNGQRCTALKILFVHTSFLDSFLAGFTQAISQLKFGMPWEEGVGITPIPIPDKCGYLSGLVEDATHQGARILNEGGGEYCQTFFYPTVLSPVTENMRVYHEEQFGPVIPIVPYDDLNIPLTYVFSSNYGQQVSVFGQDPSTLAKLIDPLVNQVCRVNLNSQCQRGPDTFPFTGRKDSAEGTLSVSDALRVFSIRTLVAAKDSSVNKGIISTILKERKSNFLSTDFIF
jgi:glyceraldehyde-3-phosphate dehydrogenase (NADP+)